MYLTQEEMIGLSNFLNSLPIVTKDMASLAVKLKEVLYAVPEVQEEVVETKKVAKTKTAVKKTVKKHATKSTRK